MDYLRRWLGIDELERRVDELESKLGSFERLVTSTLDSYGQYASRSDGELNMMRDQLMNLEQTIEAMIQDRENERDAERGRRLLRRIRNNLTRVQNAKAASGQ